VHGVRRDKRRIGTNAAVNTASDTRTWKPKRAARTGANSGNDANNDNAAHGGSGYTANESRRAAGNHCSGTITFSGSDTVITNVDTVVDTLLDTIAW